MAWSVVGTPNVGSGATSVSLTKPTGVTTNDFIIINVVSDVSAVSVSGFSTVGITDLGGLFLSCFAKRASGSEPSSYTVNAIGSATIQANISAFRGGSLINIVNASNTPQINSGASAVADSLSTTVSGCLLLFILFRELTTTATTPSGMTSILDSSTDDNSFLAYEILSSAGASGTRTSTLGTSLSGWITAMIALEPPPLGHGLLLSTSRNLLIQ